MNEQALGAIENRWLEASSGPWSVDDYRDKSGSAPVLMTTREAFERYQMGKTKRIETIKMRSQKDAEDQGLDAQVYVDAVADRAHSVDAGKFVMNFRAMTAMTRAKLTKTEKEEDAAAFPGGCHMKGSVSPLFLIATDASDGDVEFVRNASEDVGSLISEVRKSWDHRVRLNAAYLEQKAELEKAKEKLKDMQRAMSDMMKLSKKIAAMEALA